MTLLLAAVSADVARPIRVTVSRDGQSVRGEKDDVTTTEAARHHNDIQELPHSQPPSLPRMRSLDFDLHRVGLKDLFAARDAVHDLAADLGRDLVVRLEAQHLEERLLLLGRQVLLVPACAFGSRQPRGARAEGRRKRETYRCTKTRNDWCHRTGIWRVSRLNRIKWNTSASTTLYGSAYFLSSRTRIKRLFGPGEPHSQTGQSAETGCY